MSVKRYQPAPFNERCLHAIDDGEYVKHEDYAALEARCAALAAENAGLSEFVDALLSIAWQGGSADGADIQVLALKHGLLCQEVYSADEHENQVDDPGNFEDGDPVYFRVKTPVTDAFLAEVRAHGVEMFAGDEKKLSESHMQDGNLDTAIQIASSSRRASEFAAQLRRGSQS